MGIGFTIFGDVLTFISIIVDTANFVSDPASVAELDKELSKLIAFCSTNLQTFVKDESN
jgi:hypothetical protein